MPVIYTQKLNAFVPTKCWTVEDGGLRWADQDKGFSSGFIPWSEITATRLRFEPSRAERRRTALHVYTPIDHAITNINYRGIYNFQLQQEAFLAFIDAYHRGMARSGSTSVFHKGSTKGAYIGNIAIILFALLLLLAVAELVSLSGVPGLTTIIRLGILAFFIPALIKYFKKNKPATYTPENWPRGMLEV